jgi:protein TonB
MTSIPVASKKSYRKYLPIVVGTSVLVIVVIAVVLLIRNFLSDSDEPKKHKVQQISLIKPEEPPPPPPKPPEEKPPEPKEEIKQEEQKQPTPQPDTGQPPPGIGSAGYGSGDTSFGGSGGWMGGSGRFGFYLGGVQKGIHDELNRNEKLRKSEYKVEVALWIGKDGIISRFELLGSSGDNELDALMKKALVGARFDEPPSDIPQPIKLRISSR